VSAYVRQAAIGGADRLLSLSVLCILLGLYTVTLAGIGDDTETEIQFQTTSAIARTGWPALGGTPEAEAIVAEARSRSDEDYPVRPGVSGESYYAQHGIGQALVAVPFYALGQVGAVLWPELEQRHVTVEEGRRSEYFAHIAVGWRNALWTALLAGLLLETARRLGVSRRSAWLAALMFGVATYAWPLARSSLPDVQTTFFLFLAFHVIVLLREMFERLTAPKPRTLALLGLALGLALLTRPSVGPAVLVLAIGAFLVLRAGRAQFLVSGAEGLRRRSEKLRWISVMLAVPLIGCLVLLAVLDQERSGDPFATLRAMWVHEALRPGLGDEILAPGNGLLWLAPAVLLCPIGFVVAWRNGERLWPWMLLGVAAAVTLPVTTPENYFDTPTYGPRYVLPVLPFAWLGVARALDRAASSTGLRVLAGALFLFGVLAAVPAVLVDAGTYRDLALQATGRGAGSEALAATPTAVVGSEPAAAGDFGEDVSGEDIADLHWDWRFAAPWAYWRILRHRVAGGGEVFDAEELFAVPSNVPLTPTRERDRGFRHIFWVDLMLRLGGPGWAPQVLAIVLLILGLGLASRGFQPGRA